MLCMCGVLMYLCYVGVCVCVLCVFFFFFFFNDTATTEIYTLSLHDALPIWRIVKLWLFWELFYEN